MNREERKDREGKLVSTHQENIRPLYDEEADVLYLNFKKPSHANDAEFVDSDVIIRYENEEVVGITVMNASKKLPTLRLHDLSTSGETSEVTFKTLLYSLLLFSSDFMNERIQPPAQNRDPQS